MYKITGKCPVCAGTMMLERLRCRRCGTALEGSFEWSELFSLDPEHLHFVELLVKYRGNIQRVSEELGVSYRTGRNRMEEIADSLGYVASDLPAPSSPVRRKEILEALEQGQVDAEQAVRLLRGEQAEEE